MKKPQYKDSVAASFCQVFYRQYLLSPSAFFSKKCYRTQNYIHYNQKLLKLTYKRAVFRIFSPSENLTTGLRPFAAVQRT